MIYIYILHDMTLVQETPTKLFGVYNKQLLT